MKSFHFVLYLWGDSLHSFGLNCLCGICCLLPWSHFSMLCMCVCMYVCVPVQLKEEMRKYDTIPSPGDAFPLLQLNLWCVNL